MFCFVFAFCETTTGQPIARSIGFFVVVVAIYINDFEMNVFLRRKRPTSIRPTWTRCMV